MATKKILGVLLMVVFLVSSIYFIFDEKVRVDIEKTKTKYSVWENEKWVLAATEYVNLFDGSKKMRASSRNLDYWVAYICEFNQGNKTIQLKGDFNSYEKAIEHGLQDTLKKLN